MSPSGMPAQAVRHLKDLTTWHEATFDPESNKNFNSTALPGLKVTRSTVGHLRCDFPVLHSAQSDVGTLHEGCLATLFDVMTSGALVSLAPHGGISVNMSVNYLLPITKDHICEVEAKITKAGRKLVFAEAVARDKNTGNLAATYTDVKMIPQIRASNSPESPVAIPIGTPELSASPEAAHAFVESLVAGTSNVSNLQATGTFDTTALYGLKDITASSGRLTCTLPVKARVQNTYSTLHGGCIATLVEVVGSAAIMTVAEGFTASIHVSVDYLSELPDKEECEATGLVSHLGKTTATASVELRLKRTGRLAARGVHVRSCTSSPLHIRQKL